MNRSRKDQKRKRDILITVLAILAAVVAVVEAGLVYKMHQLEKKVAAQEKTEQVRQVKVFEEEPPQAPRQTPEPEKTREAAAGYLEDLEGIQAGEVVESSRIDSGHLEKYFYAREISEQVFQRIYKLSFKEDCTVPREQLRYVKVLHWGFDGNVHVGELIVNGQLAQDFTEIFRQLYEAKYEIEKMHLIDDYGAEDDVSIDDNNTSCFNFRTATGLSTLSNHATGCAIDINPQQNPFVEFQEGDPVWYHENADPFVDRSQDFPHKIDHEDLCYQLFTARGFSWGGDWENPKDYQHFEKAVTT